MIISNKLELAFFAVLGLLCGHFWNVHTLASRHTFQIIGPILRLLVFILAFLCLNAINFVNVHYTIQYFTK